MLGLVLLRRTLCGCGCFVWLTSGLPDLNCIKATRIRPYKDCHPSTPGLGGYIVFALQKIRICWEHFGCGMLCDFRHGLALRSDKDERALSYHPLPGCIPFREEVRHQDHVALGILAQGLGFEF